MLQKKEKKGKKISMITIQDHAIIGSLENEFLRIEPYGPNAIRVRASMGKISDENWTLLSPEASDCKIVTQEDGSLRMKEWTDRACHHSGQPDLLLEFRGTASDRGILDG